MDRSQVEWWIELNLHHTTHNPVCYTIHNPKFMLTLAETTVPLPELIQKIQSSLMGDKQKRALLAVLPRATEVDRAQIVALIDKSNTEADQIKKEYELHVGDINVKYQKKLDELVKVEKKRAYETFEKMEEDKKVETMMAIENEIKTVKEAAAVSAVPTLAHKKEGAKALSRLLFFLFALGLLAAGAWITLGFLTIP